jgi:hypothetical protein
MNRLGKLFVAAAIVMVPVGCKNKVRKEADKAAENLKDQKDDLRDESKELREAQKDKAEDERDLAKARANDSDLKRKINEAEVKHDTKDVVDETKDLSKEAVDVAKAKQTFDYRRQERVNQLHALHAVIASQPMLINAISPLTPLTDKARNDLSEKMQVFQMRLDEAGNLIQQLQVVHEDNFENRDDATNKAMDRLKDARSDAWKALNDGDRIEPS